MPLILGVRLARAAGEGPVAGLAGVGTAERGHRPPADAEVPGGRPDLGQRLESGRAEIDGSLAAAGRVHPGSVEELLAGPDQVIGPGPDPLGIAGEDQAARGDVVEQ